MCVCVVVVRGGGIDADVLAGKCERGCGWTHSDALWHFLGLMAVSRPCTDCLFFLSLTITSDCRHKMLATQLRELRRVRGDIERKLKVCLFAAVASACHESCERSLAVSSSFNIFCFCFDVSALKREDILWRNNMQRPLHLHFLPSHSPCIDLPSPHCTSLIH